MRIDTEQSRCYRMSDAPCSPRVLIETCFALISTIFMIIHSILLTCQPPNCLVARPIYPHLQAQHISSSKTMDIVQSLGQMLFFFMRIERDSIVNNISISFHRCRADGFYPRFIIQIWIF
jgi:hypothetical protein